MSANIDYPAMLADMESKRDALIASIASLREFLGLPAQGGADSARPSSIPGQSTPVASELPKGALLKKSIPEAIKLYLKSVAAKRTTREITEALQAHGVESLSSNFFGIVFTALKRLKKSQEVLQFEEGWGLAEFYPAHIRAAMVATPSSNSAKKKAAKAKAKPKPRTKDQGTQRTTVPEPKATLTPAPAHNEGVEHRLEQFVNSLATPRSGREIASALDIKPQTAALVLSKLAHNGRVAKTEDGKFGPKGSIRELPKAS